MILTVFAEDFGQIRSDDVDTPYIQRQHCQIFRFISEINFCNPENFSFF